MDILFILIFLLYQIGCDKIEKPERKKHDPFL